MRKRMQLNKILLAICLALLLSLSTSYLGKSNGVYAAGTSVNLSKYMILMDDQFEGNTQLNQFIDWKKHKGNDVVVVKTSQIPSNITGAPTHDEIVAYMRGLSDQQYPDYLLIIGDETNQNGVAGKAITFSGTYSDIDIKSRNNDNIPDLYCGRLPASNGTELSAMLNKVLMMDRTPPNSGMYDKVLVAGGIGNDRDVYTDMEDIQKFGEVSDGIACYFEGTPGGKTYQCTRAMMSWGPINQDTKWFDWRIPAANNDSLGDPFYRSYLWDGASGAAAKIGSRVANSLVSEQEARTRIFNSINSGTALVNFDTHGNPSGLAYPNIDNNDISSLTNGNNLPLVITNACLAGGYNYTENGVNKSYLKPWLTNPNGGAYAVIASTVTLISPTPGWFNHGIYMSFLPGYRTWFNQSTTPDFTSELPVPNVPKIPEGTATRLGQMLYYAQTYCSNMEAGSDFYNIQLYGDPEANIQLHTPVSQNVTHDTRIFSGKRTVNINTHESGSEVTLYSSELGIHQKVTTGDDGIATFDIDPLSKGSINVTVIKSDKRPYEGTISVRKYGDLNNDGLINSIDKSLIQRHLLGTSILTGDNALAADVNGDGIINSTDASWIDRYIMGTISVFPVEQ